MYKFLLERYLIRTQFKVLLLWFAVLGFSAFRHFGDVPENYFSTKRNFLNMYFVKWSWGWTLGLLIPYAAMMSVVYSCEHWKKGLFATGIRFLIATGLWYFWTVVVFGKVRDSFGSCVDSETKPVFTAADRLSCENEVGGPGWIGYDISGHAFILTFTSLMISSELQIQRYWTQVPKQSTLYGTPPLELGSKAHERLKYRYKLTETASKVLFTLNCVLSVLWEISLVLTCLYYHDYLSKAIGASLGILSWMCAYSELFKSRFLPIFPGNGRLKKIITDLPLNKIENGALVEKKNG